MLFVFQGTEDDAGPVFEGLWPEARAVSDPTLFLYRAFGLGRGGPGEMFSPRVLWRGMQAWRKGYQQGKAVGDPWMMPGAFLIEEGRVVWFHDYAHAGDRPDFAALRAGSSLPPSTGNPA